jgi:(S)-2-hydroxyglutarate dehydrogenase
MPESVDVVIVGAGIVGLATARALRAARPDARVVVLDKEAAVGAHQTGHNSGVVHSGIYYPPGSLKARLVKEGRQELQLLCRQRGLHLDVCGKVVVATTTDELTGLATLAERARANGVAATLMGPGELREREPHVAGLGALHVPSAAIVDFAEIARSLADDLGADRLALGEPVVDLHVHSDGVEVSTSNRTWRARVAVNCAGLHADVLARAAGADPTVRIVAFRGEYLELVPSRRHLVRHLVYPVPDPRFPFLGVHFTRMVDGNVHAGPNAVLALSREGYRWRDVDLGHLRELSRSDGLRHLAARHWLTGTGEVVRSISTRAMVRQLRRLVPEVAPTDLVAAGSGVRAQALRPDGSLVDDFVIERTGPIVHVLNAPSPAATASLAIGRHVARLADEVIPT